ncbi:hypothetical protein RUND412_008673 [Rhizina undulata]
MLSSAINNSHVNNNNIVINSDVERSKILEWLSRVPFEDHHLFIRPLRQAGTGKWLLEKEDFVSWKHSPSSSILWLRGIESAGAGKTTLASMVIDSFASTRANNHAVAYFYCKHGEKDRQDSTSILSTLVKQLSLNFGKLQLSESQKLIASLVENFAQTIIVIDALDECDKESRKQLLKALDIVLKSTAGVIKFFVTSRRADDIELKLEGGRGGEMYFGEINATGSVTPRLKEIIIKKLTSGADGIFLWVSLQIKSICEEKTQQAIEKSLQRLPESLKEMYSIIWDKICQQSKQNQLLAERTLKWIMCAQSPLAEAEIIDAVSIQPMDFTGNEDQRDLKVQDLLDVRQNLIVIDEQLGVLRTAHFSVNEFLEDHFKMTEAQNHAAEICLTLMCRPKIYEEPRMMRGRPLYHAKIFYEYQQLTPRPEIYDEPHPLRYYIFDHWPHHLRFSGDGSNSFLEFQKEDKRDKLTPLWVASYYHLWAICKIILKRNVGNYNIRNESGRTPLYWAAHFGNVEVFRLLLEKNGVEINLTIGFGHDTTLLWAAASGGHAGIVKILLEKGGVHMNSIPTFGATPITAAVNWGLKAMVMFGLIKETVDLNFKNINGETPLWAAASRGHDVVIKLLLEKEGVDIDSKTETGETPLLIVARYGHDAAVKILLQNECMAINSKTTRDETPLWAAASEGRETVVKLLLKKEGVDINSKNIFGQTPLWAAAFEGREAVVKLLLETEGVDINARNCHRTTPLSAAAGRGRDAIVKLLLEKEGVDINPKNYDSETPLWIAAKEGRETVVKRLLEKEGVDINS